MQFRNGRLLPAIDSAVPSGHQKESQHKYDESAAYQRESNEIRGHRAHTLGAKAKTSRRS
jgi:hypothetical protein